MRTQSERSRGVSHVSALCALLSMTMVIMSGTFAFAESPVIQEQLLRETMHAESHPEPSDEELQKIARMHRAARVPVTGPSASTSIGYPNRGVLRFGVRIEDSDTLMVKVGSRTTRHGTGELVGLLQDASAAVSKKFPGSVLTVGDLSREGGGRIRPHKSHQNGRDVDLGFYMLNDRKKEANLHLFLRVGRNGAVQKRKWAYHFDSRRNWALIEAMLEHPSIDVQHIFVANSIQRQLLARAKKTKANRETIYRAKRLLRQPRRGSPHRTHFHIRIFCPEDDMPRCKDRAPYYSWHPKPVAPWLEQVADDS